MSNPPSGCLEMPIGPRFVSRYVMQRGSPSWMGCRKNTTKVASRGEKDANQGFDAPPLALRRRHFPVGEAGRMVLPAPNLHSARVRKSFDKLDTVPDRVIPEHDVRRRSERCGGLRLCGRGAAAGRAATPTQVELSWVAHAPLEVALALWHGTERRVPAPREAAPVRARRRARRRVRRAISPFGPSGVGGHPRHVGAVD